MPWYVVCDFGGSKCCSVDFLRHVHKVSLSSHQTFGTATDAQARPARPCSRSDRLPYILKRAVLLKSDRPTSISPSSTASSRLVWPRAAVR